MVACLHSAGRRDDHTFVADDHAPGLRRVEVATARPREAGEHQASPSLGRARKRCEARKFSAAALAGLPAPTCWSYIYTGRDSLWYGEAVYCAFCLGNGRSDSAGNGKVAYGAETALSWGMVVLAGSARTRENWSRNQVSSSRGAPRHREHVTVFI